MYGYSHLFVWEEVNMKQFTNIEKACLFVIGFYLCIAIISIFWTPYDPTVVDIYHAFETPSWNHWLGTDSLGRDVVSRLMVSAEISIFFCIITAALTMTLGLILGVVGGYYKGRVDFAIQSLVNIFQGIPGYAFMIALAGILEPSLYSVIIAVVITSWTSFSQVVRSEVLSITSREYVAGAKVLGASNIYIIFRYILPLLLPLILFLLSIRISTTVLMVYVIIFICLGLQPPMTDWGTMIQEGQTYFRTYPILLYAPGLCILTFCGALNYIGESYKKQLV